MAAGNARNRCCVKPENENGGPEAAVGFRQWAPDYSSGTISNATMLMILISGFTAGPAVSL